MAPVIEKVTAIELTDFVSSIVKSEIAIRTTIAQLKHERTSGYNGGAS